MFQCFWGGLESKAGRQVLGFYISTQVTFVPISAKQVPVTRPTYPVPTIAMFILVDLFQVIHIPVILLVLT